MKSFTAADGPHGTSIHYVVAGPHEQPLCRTAVERSALCRQLCKPSSANTATATVRPPLRVLAYCIDDHWVRAVIQLPWRARLGQHFPAGLLNDGSAELAKLGIVRSAPLVTVTEQLAAVRHCHFAPVELQLVREPPEWHWSSHRVYLGQQEMPGFTRGWLATVLAESQGGWLFAYQHLMSNPEEGEAVVSFPKWSVPILPIAELSGDPSCLRALKRAPTHPASGAQSGTERVFKSLVREVCRTTGCDAHAFLENPGARRFRLERALLLERLDRLKVMSVRELSHRLKCDRSWLYKTRVQCRQQYPHLFGGDGGLKGRSRGPSRSAEKAGVETVISKARRGRPDGKS